MGAASGLASGGAETSVGVQVWKCRSGSRYFIAYLIRGAGDFQPFKLTCSVANHSASCDAFLTAMFDRSDKNFALYNANIAPSAIVAGSHRQNRVFLPL